MNKKFLYITTILCSMLVIPDAVLASIDMGYQSGGGEMTVDVTKDGVSKGASATAVRGANSGVNLTGSTNSGTSINSTTTVENKQVTYDDNGNATGVDATIKTVGVNGNSEKDISMSYDNGANNVTDRTSNSGKEATRNTYGSRQNIVTVRNSGDEGTLSDSGKYSTTNRIQNDDGTTSISNQGGEMGNDPSYTINSTISSTGDVEAAKYNGSEFTGQREWQMQKSRKRPSK